MHATAPGQGRYLRLGPQWKEPNNDADRVLVQSYSAPLEVLIKTSCRHYSRIRLSGHWSSNLHCTVTTLTKARLLLNLSFSASTTYLWKYLLAVTQMKQRTAVRCFIMSTDSFYFYFSDSCLSSWLRPQTKHSVPQKGHRIPANELLRYYNINNRWWSSG